MLEFRYHRDVERAHGLPESARQVAFTTRDGRRGRRDRVYEPYDLVIELDGRLAHQPENQGKDKTRDNAAAADGKQTLRYGWSQVKWQPCETAARGGQGAAPPWLERPAPAVLARLPGPAGPSRVTPGGTAGPGPVMAQPVQPGQDRPSPARILLTLRRNCRWPNAFHTNRAGAGRFAIIA